jgi:serine/threonine protein kinase
MDTLDNKYRIEQLLGQGGMGEVYRATHLGTMRTVAVKVIHPQLSAYDQFVARFRREAEAAGRLRHPNVIDVTDFGIVQTADGPVAYLVMEYLDGCSLAEIVSEEGKLPIPTRQEPGGAAAECRRLCFGTASQLGRTNSLIATGIRALQRTFSDVL